MVGFPITKYYFTQQIYVLSDSLFGAGSEMLCELRTFLVDDDLRGIHAQALFDNRDSDKIEMIAECLIHLE